MKLRSLFKRIDSTIFLEPKPNTKIKRLLESYNSDDWMYHIKYHKLWFGNPIIHNGLEIEQPHEYIKTPIFSNKSKYFDMSIICFPPNYKTNIHDHTSPDCYFKVLDGEIKESRYNLSKLSHSQIMYNGAPVSTIGHVKKNVFHSIENMLDTPTYTLNIYTK